MEMGVVNRLRTEREDAIFAHVQAFGLKTCQLSNWNPDL